MAKMRNLQPKMQEPKIASVMTVAMSQAMMELYQKEKGTQWAAVCHQRVPDPHCFSLAAESVELRHAPFFGWITDLSVKDPRFVLPILMGVSIPEQKCSHHGDHGSYAAEDAQYMPVMFTVFFLWFPSGSVLVAGNFRPSPSSSSFIRP